MSAPTSARLAALAGWLLQLFRRGAVVLPLSACAVDARAPEVAEEFAPAPPGSGGSGNTAVSNGGAAQNTGAQGGVSSAPAQGGMSSAPTQGGAGGSGGGEPVAEGVAENALELVDGAVEPGSNPFLIYGQIGVGVSGGNSPAVVSFEPYGVCASGVSAQVPSGTSPDSVGIWDLRIGLSLSQPEGAVIGNPWDRYGGRVDGFSFELEGPAIPSELRFEMRTAGPTDESFCKLLGPVPSGARVEVLFNEMTVTCWELGGDRAQGDLFLYGVSWEVPPSFDADVPYDFCLREIAPVFVQ